MTNSSLDSSKLCFWRRRVNEDFFLHCLVFSFSIGILAQPELYELSLLILFFMALRYFVVVGSRKEYLNSLSVVDVTFLSIALSFFFVQIMGVFSESIRYQSLSDQFAAIESALALRDFSRFHLNGIVNLDVSAFSSLAHRLRIEARHQADEDHCIC